MAAPLAKRKPMFINVNPLKTGTSGHTLTVKVVTSQPMKTVANKGGPCPSRIAECLVGDKTDTIIFTAHNEQVDLKKPGSTIILRNAKIDMLKGTMRQAVDKWAELKSPNLQILRLKRITIFL